MLSLMDDTNAAANETPAADGAKEPAAPEQ